MEFTKNNSLDICCIKLKINISIFLCFLLVKLLEVKKIRARACIKCREYVKIQPDDPENQELIKSFEGNHKRHTLITLDIDEVKDQYKEVM